ncbi:MAG: DUF5689 domain-containing protein [Bacteroidales bacterium]
MKALRYISRFVIALSVLTISCSREPLPPPEPVINYVKISQLREMFADGITTIDTNIYIQGIITLTPEFKNLPAFVAYVQDSTAGICLTVTGTNTFTINSEVKIFCRGVSFTDYNGLLQFGDISITDQTEVVSLTPQLPEPRKITIADINAGKYQAEYVEIQGVQFKDPGTYSGSKTLTDCVSSVEVYTRSDATFAGQTLPTGNGSLKGVVSVYTSKQVLLRDPSELSMQANRCGVPSVTYLAQDFNTLTTNYTDVTALAGWKTISEAGTKTWYSYKTATKGPWIQATSYNSGQASVITWMIAPQVDLTNSTKPYIQFESADGYDNGATLELYISTDYTGSATPWTSTWTKLNFTLPPSNASGYSAFVPSGQIDLSAFNGNTVYLAWVYKGGAPSKTTTWEVDNVIIAEK